MDGLVSTGNKIPYTILKIIFTNKKQLGINFIHIFHLDVNISAVFSGVFFGADACSMLLSNRFSKRSHRIPITFHTHAGLLKR